MVLLDKTSKCADLVVEHVAEGEAVTLGPDL